MDFNRDEEVGNLGNQNLNVSFTTAVSSPARGQKVITRTGMIGNPNPRKTISSPSSGIVMGNPRKTAYNSSFSSASSSRIAWFPQS